MVFKNNFVAVVKCDGKILREIDGVVRLPFGSEYSILMKNLDSRKVVVSVDIDGENVTDGKILIDGNSSFELRGRIKGKEVSKKFKFIEKTEEISENREDRPDDGIIRIEYQFEDDKWYIYDWNKYCIPYWKFNWYPLIEHEYSWNGYYVKCSSSGFSYYCYSDNSDLNDEGITVDGSDEHQSFVEVNAPSLEQTKHVITIKLKGKTSKGNVKIPVTTREKIKCKTCGKSNKSSYKYCPHCGTRLVE